MVRPDTATRVDVLVQQILAQRGYRTPSEVERFLVPAYDSNLGDPWLMTDMKPAVERISYALAHQQPIAIYGDYDIDGLTATSLMLDFLGSLGANAIGYIPDRFEEGYGINRQALEKLQQQGIRLVVSVDCGITSLSEAAWAKKHGLDLVITDHHAVLDKLPDAIAVINPKRPGDEYPFKDLAGVGVAFKLVQALQQHLGKPALGQERWLLDLVALGTVCDVVTLVDENRVLVRYGLKVLAKTRRVGLQALADVAGVSLASVTSYHLGFMLGPRLNAAGRLENATKALELLTTRDTSVARMLAEDLNRLNQDRRDQQATILTEATAMATQYANDPVLVLADPSWAQGIVGIVASKLVERYHKPTLVLQILGETAKGSGRSTAQFNLIDNLRQLDFNFHKLGGHHFAAGFTISAHDLDQLRVALIDQISRQPKIAHQPIPADLELTDFRDLSLELIRGLEQLEPFGNGNPKPVIQVLRAKVLKTKLIGVDGKHLKLVLADDSGVARTALGFSMAQMHPNLTVDQEVEIRFHLAENTFTGYPEPEIILTQLQ